MIRSERWQTICAVGVLVGLLYFAAEDLNRGSTGDLVSGSITLWNVCLIVLSYLWWWPRRRTLETAIKKRNRIVLMLSLLAAIVAFLGLMFGGTACLEQDSLGFQVLGIVLAVMAALVLPVWSLWFYRRLLRTSSPAGV
jgi:hypothetical protein